MFDTWRLFLRDHGPGLSPTQEEQLFGEWRRVGLLIGCKDRLLGRFSRLLGLVPGPLRRSPLALFAMGRTRRDPRIVPEPVRYP